MEVDEVDRYVRGAHGFDRVDFDLHGGDDSEYATAASNQLQKGFICFNDLALTVDYFGAEDLVHAQSEMVHECSVSTIHCPAYITYGPQGSLRGDQALTMKCFSNLDVEDTTTDSGRLTILCNVNRIDVSHTDRESTVFNTFSAELVTSSLDSKPDPIFLASIHNGSDFLV